MIGAICRKLNETSWADIYLVGNYNQIDWFAEPSETKLGNEYCTYPLKENAEKHSCISIEQSLNGEYILRLRETERYIVRIRSCSDEFPAPPYFQNEGNKNLKCDRDRDTVTFQFVNYLGKTRMIFPDSGIILPFEVVPEKISYEEDYIKLTELLAEECAELLLEYSGSTSNVFRQTESENQTLLEQFVFLRQFCYGQSLPGLFEAIKRNPDRILDREEELKPFGTGLPSGSFFRNPFRYSKGWTKIVGENNGQTIYLPQKIAVTRKYDRLDTPANRFIKYALHKFDFICTELIATLSADNNKTQTECLAEATAIHEMLEDIFADGFFDDIGELDMMPQNNQILQKREGYSQIFAAYSMIDLALQLDWKGKDAVYEGESRNVALLYEYWLFFELYNTIKSIEGCELVSTEDDPFIKTDNGITISLKEGEKSCQFFAIRKYGVRINLYYNRTFNPRDFITTKYEGSYSRPFRPDYTIAIFPDSISGRYNGEEDAVFRGVVSYIHFDAKYRITDLTSFIGKNGDAECEEEIIEEKTDSVINTYKRGDLLKMHTYNDAIRRTVGSYVLYPGSYSKNGNKTFRLYDEILPGVGAFSIKPSIKEAGEKVLKDFIVSVIESGNARDSRLNRMNYYSEMILSEPSRFNSQTVGVKQTDIRKGDLYVLGYIRGKEFSFLQENNLLKKNAEFYYYFYAIKEQNVYSHHKDLFKISFFRIYVNNPVYKGKYILEPVLCRIISSELVSRKALTEKLAEIGYITAESDHKADYYYIMKVKVIDDDFGKEELGIRDVNKLYGNDSFSPTSPKIMNY